MRDICEQAMIGQRTSIPQARESSVELDIGSQDHLADFQQRRLAGLRPSPQLPEDLPSEEVPLDLSPCYRTVEHSF